MERWLKWGIVILAIFIGAYLIYDTMLVDERSQIGDGRTLPNFSFLRLGEKGDLDRSDLSQDMVVVVYFSPNCQHCQSLAADLGTKVERLTNIDWVWITRFDKGEAIKFAETYGLNAQPNVHFGLDQNARFYQFFGDMFTPSVYIYKDEKLLNVLAQDTQVKDILMVLDGLPTDKFRKTR